MALLYIDSFDHYGNAEVLAKWTSGFIVPAIAIGKGRCGTNALRGDIFMGCTKGLLFGSTRGTLGFAFKIDAHSTAIADFTLGNLGQISAWRVTDGSLGISVHGGATLGQTIPGLMHEDRWYYIELQVLLHASAGAAILRLNNIEVLNVTGVNTVGDGGTTFRTISFQCSSNRAYWIDDLYVLDDTGPAPCNDFLGDCRVEYLRPRAPGAYQQWTVAGTASTHYGAVDDAAVPDEDGSYVESIVPGQIDTNKYQPTGLPSGTIYGAQLSLYARKSEIGPRVIAPVVNNVVGAPVIGVSAENYVYYNHPYCVYGLNPATGSPWSIAEINAIECGVKVIS